MARSLVIDGSVLCGKDSGKEFDYSRLTAAVEDVYETYGHRDFTLKVFVDASLRWKLSASDKKLLEKDLASGAVEQTPAGLPADPFILRWAEAHGAIVISNDLYREWAADFPWVSEQGSGRVVSGVFDTQAGHWTFLERHSGGVPRELSELIGISRPAPLKDMPNKFTDPTKGRYIRKITRAEPTAIMFLVDQSASMREPWSHGDNKAQALASIVNDCVMELVLQCTRYERGKGEVRDYLHLAIVGYGGEGDTALRSEISGSTLNNPFKPISFLHEETLENLGPNPDSPQFLAPRADGPTPMTAALHSAEAAIARWTKQYPNSYPPVVFNITDGEPTDGEPIDAASRLTKLSTNDGHVLLFNAHISSDPTTIIEFPEHLSSNAETSIRRMFNISSHIPESMRKTAQELGVGKVSPASRGFLYNASPAEVAALLDIGTPGTELRVAN